MRFIVRYWSSILPAEFRKADGSPRLIDYSIHPPTRMGLHNALLSYHDRLEIIEAHGGQYECAVYVEEGINSYVLTHEIAVSLFNALPNGQVKWTTIRKFLLPQNKDDSVAGGDTSHEQQLHMFEYNEVSDADTASPHFDVDA